MVGVASVAAAVEAQRCLGLLVDGFAERVSRQEAQAARKPLLDFCLQRVVMRTVASAPISEIAQVRARAASGGVGTGIRGRRDRVAFAEFVKLGSLGAGISDFPNRVPPQIPLDAEIPVLDVRVVELWVQREQRRRVRIGQGIQWEALRQVVHLRIRLQETDRCVSRLLEERWVVAGVGNAQRAGFV